MPSKFPRADRVTTDADAGDDAPSRVPFWERPRAREIPGVTRLSSSRLRPLAEGTNPPRAPESDRSTTREETAPVD